MNIVTVYHEEQEIFLSVYENFLNHCDDSNEFGILVSQNDMHNIYGPAWGDLKSGATLYYFNGTSVTFEEWKKLSQPIRFKETFNDLLEE